MTPEVFWEAVQFECRESEAKAREYDRCRANLSEVTQYRDELHGQIEILEGLSEERLEAVRSEAVLKAKLESRLSPVTWIAISASALLLGFGAGFVAGL